MPSVKLSFCVPLPGTHRCADKFHGRVYIVKVDFQFIHEIRVDVAAQHDRIGNVALVEKAHPPAARRRIRPLVHGVKIRFARKSSSATAYARNTPDKRSPDGENASGATFGCPA